MRALSRPLWIEILAVSVLYFLTARLGLLLAIPGGHITPVWPPSGIALAAVILLGRKIWPGIILGSFVTNFWDFPFTPEGITTTLIFGIGSLLSALVGATLLRQFRREEEWLSRPADIVRFAAISGGSCLISATIGVTALFVFGQVPWSSFSNPWLTWWLGDTAGMLIVTPLILAWSRPLSPLPTNRAWFEIAGSFLLLTTVTGFVFIYNSSHYLGNRPLAFLVIPCLIWPAMRFGERGTTAAIAIIAFLSVWGTVNGSGPFHLADLNTSLLLLESFLCTVVLTALCIAAITRERQQAKAALDTTLQDLESRVRARTAELEQTNSRLLQENRERALADARVQQLLTEATQSRVALLSLLEDQKQTQATLQSVAESKAAILNALPAHIALLDREGNIMAVNESWRRFATANAARSQDFYVGQNYVHICELATGECAEESRQIAEGLRQVLAGTSTSFSLEYPCHSPTEQRWYQLMATPLFDDRAEGAVVMHVNVTDRRQAQEFLRETEERFRQLTDNIKDVFWITDPAKRTALYVSPAYEHIWGRTRQSLYDHPASWHEAINSLDRPRILRASDQMALGTYDVDYRIIRPDNTVRWIHDKAFPVRDDSGKVTRIVGVAEDITERHHLEEQLRQAQKMEAIGTLAGGIAHDFNNILAAVKGYAQLAKADAKDQPVLRNHLDAVLQGTLRATHLVSQIVTFSRQQEPQYSAVRLQYVVREAIVLLRATIPALIDFKSEIDADAPAIFADPTQLHQVVMNLGTNAWQSMQGGSGRLEIRLAAVDLDAIFVKPHPELQPGRHVRLTVADTGCGMDQAVLNRIFEPFFTTKPPGEGSGLGLAVVHGIIKNHRAAIIVQSEPKVGTTFQLYFPTLAIDDTIAPTPETSPAPPTGRNEHILLVDDEVPITRMATIILEKAGYQVHATNTAPEALSVFQADPTRFALLISDLTMPKMSGFELATELRKFRPTLPVILTSGNIDKQVTARVAALGIQAILSKPFSIESLQETVHQLLTMSTPR